MKYSVCKRRPHEHIVQNNLSLTPSQIAEMTKKGIPVSTQSLQGIYETPTQGHDVDPIYQRGVDMNDLWNAQKRVQTKVRNIKQKVQSGQIETIKD